MLTEARRSLAEGEQMPEASPETVVSVAFRDAP